MKKRNILILGALGFCLMACDDKSDLGIEQVNPQLSPIDPSTLVVALSPEFQAGLNLNTSIATTIPAVVIVDPIENLPANQTTEFEIEVASNESFDNAITISVTDGSVPTASLERACYSFYGVDPSTQDMYVRVAAYAVEGNQVVRIGGFDKWYATSTIKITPVDAELAVESEYYLVLGHNSVPFTHSDDHYYVDPVFTVSVDIEDNEVPLTWSITSISGHTYGVNVDTEADTMEGDLVKDGDAAILNSPGSYIWTVNMLDLTYSIEAVSTVENLWTPGAGNGWDVAGSQMLFTTDYVKYIGFAYLDSEFKFTNQPNWDGTNYGIGDEEGTLSATGENIPVSTAALYYCDVDLPHLTYSLTEITSVSLIGGFNDWSGDVELTASDNFLVWSGTLSLADSSEWKFRMNNGWDINLGGDEDNLEFNGDNITTDAGTYTVTLDLSKLPYSCTVVAQ